MMNLLAPPDETTFVHSLLEIISNPSLAKEHLERLTTEKNKALQAAASAKEAMDTAREATIKAEAARAAAQKLTDDFNATHVSRTSSLDERERLLLAKHERLTAYEAQVGAHEKATNEDFSAREAALIKREASVSHRETELQKLESSAREIKEAYELKMAKLREQLA